MKTVFTILLAVIFNVLAAQTLQFDEPFGAETWTEDGHPWSWDNAGWDNIRTYDPHSGTGHGMSAPGAHSKLGTDVNINIQGIWLKTGSASDFAYLNLKGYNESGTQIYSVALKPGDYEWEYAYVTLNWVGVKSFMVDYNSISRDNPVDLFYDDMDYSFVSITHVLNFDEPFGTETWTEDGHPWSWDNAGWDNIRTYRPHSGTGHGMSAPGYHSKLGTDVNINIQGIWLKTENASDFTYLNLAGYNESGTQIYSVALKPGDYEWEYAYVTLNWVGVKRFMVDYNSISRDNPVDLYYDDMDYSYTSARTATDTRTECFPFTWIDGNTYASDNTTAKFNMVGGASNGADSLVTLHLTVKKVSDLTTTQSGAMLTANNPLATYTWLDCNADFAVISGATGQSFTALTAGNYAVKLTENGCVDTSSCVSAVITAGLAVNSSGEYISVYPNPSSGIFTCTTATTASNLQVFNLLGKMVYEGKPVVGVQQIDLSREPKGVYYYKLVNGSQLISAGKIIIERDN